MTPNRLLFILQPYQTVPGEIGYGVNEKCFDSVSPTIEQVKQRGGRKPVVFVVDSEGGDPELAAQGATLRAEFVKGGILAYPSMMRAARALAHLYRYYSRLYRMKLPDHKAGLCGHMSLYLPAGRQARRGLRAINERRKRNGN